MLSAFWLHFDLAFSLAYIANLVMKKTVKGDIFSGIFYFSWGWGSYECPSLLSVISTLPCGWCQNGDLRPQPEH